MLPKARSMRTLTELLGSAGDDEAISATLAAMDAFNRGNAKSHSGIWRDIAVRKRKTEVPEQMMPAVEKGRVRAALFQGCCVCAQCWLTSNAAQARGMEMPITAKLIELIQDVEEGRRPQSEETADELLAVALELMELGVGAESKL